MTSAVCVYDFTAPEADRAELDGWLREWCKKWSYQLEEGEETGYRHYQGRCSLKIKKRLSYVIRHYKPIDGIHWSITSGENRDNDFYAVKEDTRVAGPWRDTDNNQRIPRDIRGIVLRPWQEELRVLMADTRNTRTVHILYDPKGNSGKSTFTRYMMAHDLGELLPCVNDNMALMQVCQCVGPKVCYIIDMPRCMNKDKLYGLYSAIEQIKGGFSYDMRYKYKRCLFDPPNVLVFTNTLPDRALLSIDRWMCLMIEDNQLVTKDWDTLEGSP